MTAIIALALIVLFLLLNTLNRRRAEKELLRANRTLKALIESNRAIIRSQDEVALLHETCRIIVEHGGYRFAWVGIAEHDPDKTVLPVIHHGFEEGYLDTIDITWADTDRGRGPAGIAIRTGKPAICIRSVKAMDKKYTEPPPKACKVDGALAVVFNSQRRGQTSTKRYPASPTI